MKHYERLVEKAVETAICEGATREQAQVNVLAAFAKVAASTGPKNIFRLVNENRVALIVDRADTEYQVPGYPNAASYIAVPEQLVRAAINWLMYHEREEREVAQGLHAILTQGAVDGGHQ